MGEPTSTLDITQIRELLPHRYPFLLLDRVVDYRVNERIVAIKNVTANEQFFNGHFPSKPVMPGVLIIEAMAQASAVLAKVSSQSSAGLIFYLVGASDVRWKRQVTPGDQLRVEMTFSKRKGPLWIMTGAASVDGQLACSATIQAMESSA